MENLNAVFIDQKIPQRERLVKLNRIAIQQMHVGDKWEVYIPAEQAYGKSNQPGIPGGSTLVFEIELIGVA